MPDPTYEPVAYRFRHPDDGAWHFAPENESEDMAVLAARGWQVERLYRRVEHED